MWYVPNYNPAYIWGPPVWGAYPALLYPGIGVGLEWWPGIDIGLYFGGWGGWGWGGWGWMPNWYGGGIFVDHSFFHRYGFRDFGGERLGNSQWVHNPEHRWGVPYGNPGVAARFGRNGGAFGGVRTFNRGELPAQQRFGAPGFENRPSTSNHSVFGGIHNGGMTRMQSDRGFSSMGRMNGGFGGMRGGFGGMHGGGGARGGRR
jgi:hypothetical protein